MNLPPRYTRLLLATVLLAGASLRFYGLDWGTDQQTGTFHTFHPDELTLVEGARLVATDLRSLPTAYAKFPSYLLYAAARISGSILGLDLLNTENNSTVRALHLFARYLSATLGTLTLVLVFLIGKRLAGPGTALLATTLLAFSPGHIQQSHYYTVDVAFTCWTVLALYFMIQMPSPNLRPYLAAGLATGLAAGTRLLGGLLCVPFLVAHLFPARGVLLPFRTRLQTCFSQRAFLCAGIVLLLVFLCAPYLILDPARFFSDADMRNFKPSAEIARGERIRIWNLYDFSTTPYLFYFTHLFRYALGLPLELAGLAGLGLALRRRNPQALILLCWFAAYLALVGGLHTRPIRYATPVLPVLILLGAWACVEIGRRFSTHRILAALPALLVTFPTLALGLSTVRVYHIEDARIQAARWIQQNIPQGENIYVERGGFPTAWMAPSDQYRQIVDGASFFINVGGGMLYSAEAEVIVKKLKAAQWIVLIEENRMQQYRAVPDRYPVAFSFYSRLNAGTLGYEQMAEFKVSPGLGPWTWDPSDADPTVTAYDHPHVRIFKRRPDLEIDTHLENWVSSIRSDPSLPDAVLLKGVQAYEQGQLDEAALAFRKTVKIRPSLVLGHVLLHATYLRQGHHQEAKQTWQKVLHHTGPQLIQTSISLYQLGMDAEAIAFMEQAAQASEPDRLKFRNAFLDLAEI
ncbi:MAG: phospholipid carrier-dependent glycosyltransferase, partial [Chloroflexi bacterium]|nr:phospholipid carrier-dependent glycosyltransferase [Chloroflexota bacterium]